MNRILDYLETKTRVRLAKLEAEKETIKFANQSLGTRRRWQILEREIRSCHNTLNRFEHLRILKPGPHDHPFAKREAGRARYQQRHFVLGVKGVEVL